MILTCPDEHYELETVPNATWPRLYAVNESGKRHKVSRRLWGYAIADAIQYARDGGYPIVSGRAVDGLMLLTQKAIDG